ncbi:MAG: class I SAM-dependent methyltransferase [candidate division WOR-3 bacterium]|nr:MAG: class I SAM-dependent methyltransferase [candidate division WOR-3 bacterium]
MIREISTRLHINNIIDHYHAGKNGTVLEVGCNRGFMMSELRKISGYVYGVDIDEDVVAAARQKGHPVFVCNAENLAFSDSRFDAVFSIHTIEHIPDLQKAVREFCRVLKPGGTLILVYPYEPVAGITCLPFWSLSKKGNIHLRTLNPKDLMSIVRQGELNLTQVYSGMYYGLNPNYLSVFIKPPA